ncbi:hypothetical protein [Paraburkholderia pallida]|uniref:Uncharacterized protein n=1 Tax=Paraburkholderia pallida TaxID=2547399 RepID=A0A4P7D574_9BURK|nr:hypothetical protein [Paraburkholderia pallida]QBR03926.1 hypothetical protein E1956_42690 [Paraburkholderia pallida]
MNGRILSLRWRKLTRIGFVVDYRFIGLRGLGARLNRLFLHPATLVILGFVLTGLIGNYLAYQQSERQRQNDATVKSMDEIRASFDDLSEAFSEFQFRASRLIKLEETQAPSDAIAAARKQYDEAVQKWKEHIAADGPKIGSRYRQISGNESVSLLMGDLNADTDFVDECLINNIRKQGSDPTEILLACKREYARTPDATIDGVSVESRMFLLLQCFMEISNVMRPDPQFDFQASGQVSDREVKLIGTMCYPTVMVESLDRYEADIHKELNPQLKILEAPASNTAESSAKRAR